MSMSMSISTSVLLKFSLADPQNLPCRAELRTLLVVATLSLVYTSRLFTLIKYLS